MIAFIDTEVSIQNGKITDYGAVRDDGATLHTHNAAEFDSFVSDCETWCGHNILKHDLKYIGYPKAAGHLFIDTLFLSPLLFPKKPFRLVESRGRRPLVGGVGAESPQRLHHAKFQAIIEA